MAKHDCDKFIEAMYGKEKYENMDYTLCGDKKIFGWYLIGFDTIEEFYEKFGRDKLRESYLMINV